MFPEEVLTAIGSSRVCTAHEAVLAAAAAAAAVSLFSGSPEERALCLNAQRTTQRNHLRLLCSLATVLSLSG